MVYRPLSLARIPANAGHQSKNTSAKQVDKIEKKIHGYEAQGKHKDNTYVELEGRLIGAVAHEQESAINFETAINKQETVRIVKSEIGKVYHPYNIETGEKQSSEQVSRLLEACFESINDPVYTNHIE